MVEFTDLVLLADTWTLTEELVRERDAEREREHPDGKWTLDQLRIALAKLKPQTYGRWTNADVAAMLRKEGVEVKTIRIGNTTAKGVRKVDVERVMRDREARGRALPAPNVTGNVTGQSQTSVTVLTCRNIGGEGV